MREKRIRGKSYGSLYTMYRTGGGGSIGQKARVWLAIEKGG